VAGSISVSFGAGKIAFSYRGRDSVRRTTEIGFSRPPAAISSREVRWRLPLRPHQFEHVVVRVQPRLGRPMKKMGQSFDEQLELLAASYRAWDEGSTAIESDNELFDRELLRASRYDMRTLIEHTPFGLVPDADIPWYSVPFGRDAIIAALQTLMYNHSISEGTLRFLAANQGKEVDPFREEEPGKILHELRRGELARLREVPHTPYFGTVDSTPLFLILFTEAMDWTNSDQLYEDILPAARAALDWIDNYGDIDGDGYVEYIAHRPGGVVNHGWKDSANSVQYDDGTNAVAPIALVEVQGYVYQAKVGMARLLRRRGQEDWAQRLEREAADLRDRFNRDFWMADEQFFALALDRNKQQVRSVTSNPGHLLWSEICVPDKAEAVGRRLLEPDMFSGWGIRTLSSRSPNYNPMSYHNGSVWPHDNAMIALGLARYGQKKAAAAIFEGLFAAAGHMEMMRFPELFCGFPRRRGTAPVLYPVACAPQAWASVVPFALLQACLGLDLCFARREIRFHNPQLPRFLEEIQIHDLELAGATVNFRLRRRGAHTEVAIVSQRGDVSIKITQ